MALHEEGLALQREIGDNAGVAALPSNLGVIAAGQRNYALAWALYEESLALRREIGDRPSEQV